MKELNARNTETLEQVLKQQNEKIEEQQKRIDSVLVTLGSLINKIEALERILTLQKARSTGHGPSV